MDSSAWSFSVIYSTIQSSKIPGCLDIVEARTFTLKICVVGAVTVRIFKLIILRFVIRLLSLVWV